MITPPGDNEQARDPADRSTSHCQESPGECDALGLARRDPAIAFRDDHDDQIALGYFRQAPGQRRLPAAKSSIMIGRYPAAFAAFRARSRYGFRSSEVDEMNTRGAPRCFDPAIVPSYGLLAIRRICEPRKAIGAQWYAVSIRPERIMKTS